MPFCVSFILEMSRIFNEKQSQHEIGREVEGHEVERGSVECGVGGKGEVRRARRFSEDVAGN
jgi:hypothetical protein